MSLKKQIYNYIGDDWVASSKIEDFARELGYKGSNKSL